MKAVLLFFISAFVSINTFAARIDDLKTEVRRKHNPISYQRAQVELLGNVALVQLGNGQYGIHEVYCQTIYGPDHLRGQVGPRVEPDSRIINVEHTQPQSMFKMKNYFRQAVGDLHHLYPSDSPANSMRGNFPFGEVSVIKNTPRCFDNRQQMYDSGAKLGTAKDGRPIVFEPPTVHKGNVARALFYFAIRYDHPIEAKEEATLRRWHKEDPVDEEELDRNDAIEKIQGNRNPFIDRPEFVEDIANF